MPEPGQRWKWAIAYDGQAFEGWQSQPSGNTIQDHLERALAEIKGVPQGTRIHGSGRTDAGVHAEGQVAHVDVPAGLGLSAESWLGAMNARLPASIRVLSVEAVDRSFHARFSVVEKSYHYKVFFGKILPPMLAGRVWHLHGHLDTDGLRRCAAILQGRHDFQAFAANRGPHSPPPRSTIRTIKAIEIAEKCESLLILRFTADGFLFRMVRLMMGTMVQVAQRKLSEENLIALLEGRAPLKTSACAPAHGLYLSAVVYA